MYSDGYLRRRDGVAQGTCSLDDSLNTAQRLLQPHRKDFDAIAVRGMSGVVVGSILAHKWNKQLLIVRKDEDTTHGIRIEGMSLVERQVRYVILDDFISSGATIKAMLDVLYQRELWPPIFITFYRPDCILIPPSEQKFMWGATPIKLTEGRRPGLWSVSTDVERMAAA